MDDGGGGRGTGGGEPPARPAGDEWDAGRVRRLREHLGLTQEEMSELLNARQQTISEWERGRHRPRGPSARLLSYVAEDSEFEYGAAGAEAPAEDRGAAGGSG